MSLTRSLQTINGKRAQLEIIFEDETNLVRRKKEIKAALQEAEHAIKHREFWPKGETKLPTAVLLPDMAHETVAIRRADGAVLFYELVEASDST